MEETFLNGTSRYSQRDEAKNEEPKHETCVSVKSIVRAISGSLRALSTKKTLHYYQDPLILIINTFLKG